MKTIWKTTIITLVSILLLFSLVGCTGPAGIQGPAGLQGTAGISVTSATVNGNGHLILTMSNGQSIDAGNVIGPQGPAGQPADSAISFSSIIPQVEPTIVRIDVSVQGGLASGSGTIIDNRGYIVTNAHVVAGARSIQVTLKDGTLLAATVIASDTNQDLAIIKLTTTRTNFPVMTLGTMSDVLVGEAVMAGGFPMGTDLPGPATFTQGVVSALRNYYGAVYIQVDAAVNPGNSGGCLFTLSGKMIGIPSSGLVPPGDYEDINLAIPIDQVAVYIGQYVK